MSIFVRVYFRSQDPGISTLYSEHATMYLLLTSSLSCHLFTITLLPQRLPVMTLGYMGGMILKNSNLLPCRASLEAALVVHIAHIHCMLINVTELHWLHFVEIYQWPKHLCIHGGTNSRWSWSEDSWWWIFERSSGAVFQVQCECLSDNAVSVLMTSLINFCFGWTLILPDRIWMP